MVTTSTDNANRLVWQACTALRISSNIDSISIFSPGPSLFSIRLYRFISKMNSWGWRFFYRSNMHTAWPWWGLGQRLAAWGLCTLGVLANFSSLSVNSLSLAFRIFVVLVFRILLSRVVPPATSLPSFWFYLPIPFLYWSAIPLKSLCIPIRQSFTHIAKMPP